MCGFLWWEKMQFFEDSQKNIFFGYLPGISEKMKRRILPGICILDPRLAAVCHDETVYYGYGKENVPGIPFIQGARRGPDLFLM